MAQKANDPDIMSLQVVHSRYRLVRHLGGGRFGEVYLASGPGNQMFAIKFERTSEEQVQLRHEFKVYREIKNVHGHGFARAYHFGTQGPFNYLVMDLLGASLETLFDRCGRRFSVKTVLNLADQMLDRIQTLHEYHLVHRDIKPDNFTIGVEPNHNVVFLVDFGMGKRYRNPDTRLHYPFRDGRSLSGTPRYASINNHLGIEQTRRDDLEAIGYILIYFLKRGLPWQGLKAKEKHAKYREILLKKQEISIERLCDTCPSAFADYLTYVRNLGFNSEPDMAYLRKLFRDLYVQQNCDAIPKMWDWDPDPNGSSVMVRGVPSLPPPPPSSTGGRYHFSPPLGPPGDPAL
eukprot:CAMPEP_0182416324 /NCGR_PEP_ID=MMETSP1167-20130531/590_1 /TAXON_ID=2988 /ORGANISM="Mallomonas Sp, Strain CCMP3275" /LENGTH=346 /DNA_ID=CAMNT_0024588985 /DNA_START=294 /DNA_END=1334 /DNA_ORIENTATION=-